MTGSVAAVFDIKANLKGTFDTGAVPLMQGMSVELHWWHHWHLPAGLPGLSFPGSAPIISIESGNWIIVSILKVGPYISLEAEADVFLGITADLKVSSTFDLPQVSLVFPPDQGQSAAQVTPQNTRMSSYSIATHLYIDISGNSAIRVDVGTSQELEGRAEVHIIPRVSDNLCAAVASLLIKMHRLI